MMSDTPGKHAVEQPAPAVDPSPVLAPVAAEYDTTTHYDLSDMPEVKPLAKMLPSARVTMKRRLAEIADLLPDDLRDGELTAEDATVDTVRVVEKLIASAEDFVLDQAQDREQMADWLINQKEGEQAVMAAFQRIAERLGN